MKFKFMTKALAASSMLLASTAGLISASCSQNTSFFTIKNDAGLEIEFCDTGASIYSIKYNDVYLTYHPQDKNTFVDKEATPYYYGKTLGRVAGRFADGKFKLDGKEYTVQVNEHNDTKNNCLHGGKDAFSFKNFKRYVTTDPVKKCTNIAFNYVSQDGEAGFPETVDAWVVYTLYQEKNVIDTTLFAVPSGKTVINLSTHSLFRLANEGNVLDYTLTIPATNRALYDKESEKKTGQVVVDKRSVTEDDGIYDFRAGKKIGTDIKRSADRDPVSNGYDHIWVVDNLPLANRYVNLYNPANKLNFKVSALSEKVTGFILYSNDYPRAGQTMSDGKADSQYCGITVEPYTFFTKDNLDPIIYTPDNPFYTKFSYEISKGN